MEVAESTAKNAFNPSCAKTKNARLFVSLVFTVGVDASAEIVKVGCSGAVGARTCTIVHYLEYALGHWPGANKLTLFAICAGECFNRYRGGTEGKSTLDQKVHYRALGSHRPNFPPAFSLNKDPSRM
jgi:hypothetical protein